MKILIISIATVSLIAFAISVGVASSTNDSNGLTFNEVQFTQLNPNNVELEIHELVNQYRIDNGLEPLVFDQNLAQIARGHSKDMALRDYFEHQSPEGFEFWDRYQKNDYICNVQINLSQYSEGGENIALTDNRYSIAVDVVNAWIESPLHNENLLTDYYESHGIGVFIDDAVYVTQNFC